MSSFPKKNQKITEKKPKTKIQIMKICVVNALWNYRKISIKSRYHPKSSTKKTIWMIINHSVQPKLYQKNNMWMIIKTLTKPKKSKWNPKNSIEKMKTMKTLTIPHSNHSKVNSKVKELYTLKSHLQVNGVLQIRMNGDGSTRLEFVDFFMFFYVTIFIFYGKKNLKKKNSIFSST